ncbi:NF-kappa-B inhibitor-like protein 1 isoform X5 [Dreissena polymorpha]|uniref:NF-kappa-B inhibitor-like protein 1 isoform X3 n=1 Tax=Dreissena polymorpha TaxID=45954 RepID=UPI002264FECA|nr:NF-kappa-B inhibitor-like protein 1 isoform X3 [Dreissena polymorpha]XP_052220449.1 NF-kappa-B inhibitor-like protein 1 isoform X5 [Dreissena polymorpha]
MKPKRLSKLKQYIRENRPHKLKSLVRKHDIDLSSIQLGRSRNMVHYCCKHGLGPILRYLLQEGVSGSQQDSAGRTPLHLALHRALELETSKQWDATTECYNELLLPLIECYPTTLSLADRAGDTCRHLLQRLVERREKHEAGTSQDWSQPQGGREDERAWRDKLAEEMMFEHQEMWGTYEPDPSWDSEAEEVCDNWADRIREEYFARKRAQERATFHGNHGNRGQHCQKGVNDGWSDGRSDESEARGSEKRKETLEEARERLRKEFEKNRLKDATMDVLKLRMKYEDRYTKAMEKTNTAVMKYSDVPWPSVKGEGSDMSVLFDKLEPGSSEYRKYLRDQQVRWHPDKFLQRFGSRLCDTDREKIIARVTMLSQNLNTKCRLKT